MEDLNELPTKNASTQGLRTHQGKIGDEADGDSWLAPLRTGEAFAFLGYASARNSNIDAGALWY
jgi:hypothetical protein